MEFSPLALTSTCVPLSTSATSAAFVTSVSLCHLCLLRFLCYTSSSNRTPPVHNPSGQTGGIMSQVISVVGVEQKIFYIRGQKVMLDRDLSVLYGVKSIALRQQVKRNQDRFPDDFMFQLTHEEAKALVSQNVIPSQSSLGGYLPYAFAEQGIAMLSSVLKSKRAIHVNIAIMRAFVKIREILATHKELADRLNELERRMGRKDQEVIALFEAIRKLMAPPPEKRKRPIGFVVDGEI